MLFRRASQLSVSSKHGAEVTFGPADPGAERTEELMNRTFASARCRHSGYPELTVDEAQCNTEQNGKENRMTRIGLSRRNLLEAGRLRAVCSNKRARMDRVENDQRGDRQEVLRGVGEEGLEPVRHPAG